LKQSSSALHVADPLHGKRRLKLGMGKNVLDDMMMTDYIARRTLLRDEQQSSTHQLGLFHKTKRQRLAAHFQPAASFTTSHRLNLRLTKIGFGGSSSKQSDPIILSQ